MLLIATNLVLLATLWKQEGPGPLCAIAKLMIIVTFSLVVRRTIYFVDYKNPLNALHEPEKEFAYKVKYYLYTIF